MLKNITLKLFQITKLSSASTSLGGKCYKLGDGHGIGGNFRSILPFGVRPLFATSHLSRNNEKRENKVIGDEQGTQGEVSLTIDHLKKLEDVFPDEDTPNRMFEGIRFADLPIVKVAVTKNNTKMELTDAKGKSLMLKTCSNMGFKNARKKTTYAAQATGIALGEAMINIGIRTIRAKVGGLGPGRIAGLKGLTVGGVKVVSISDTTLINYTNDPRPKKRRRI